MSRTTARPTGSRASADRLARLLNLVPYLLARPGIEIAEAAGDLGVTERQLREDLELLWVCGLPGYGPGDLIDMAFDGDRVTITYDAGIDRPLRLTPDEALALVARMVGQRLDWASLESFLPEGLAPDHYRSAVASSFVAALELARQGRLQLDQTAAFAPLMVKAA